MKEFSKEIIEIDGKEYTLFLNREGIVAWEKYSKKDRENIEKLNAKYKGMLNGEDIQNDTDPFAGIDIETMESDSSYVTASYIKLYWVMLYTTHKFNITEVSELYNKAIEEYGETQLILLGNQMIEDVNTDNVSKQNLKNLAALKSNK